MRLGGAATQQRKGHLTAGLHWLWPACQHALVKIRRPRLSALSIAVAAVALLIVAVVGVSIAGAANSNVDLPAWLEAISTLAAFAAAGLAAYFSMQTQRQESNRARTEQASQVAAWYDETKKEPGFYLRNASDLPVTSVIIGIRLGGALVCTQPVGLLPPKVKQFVELSSASLQEIADARHRPLTRGGMGGPRCVAIAFVDAAGHGWARDADGRLSEPGQAAVNGPPENFWKASIAVRFTL